MDPNFLEDLTTITLNSVRKIKLLPLTTIIPSVAFAALVNSLIFAAIHPQGIIGIPLLTTLAVGFSLTRQWRGSLLESRL